MRTIHALTLFSAFALAAAPATAQDKKKEKVSGHCEVTKDGKTTDIDPPEGEKNPKKWCKDQGGKWEKGGKHDHGK